MSFRNLGLILGLCLVGFFSTSSAQAHRLVIFATEAIDRISGKAYFADGKGRAGWTMTLADRKGLPLAETRTEAEGRFVFDGESYAGAERPFRITLDLGDGHGQSITIGEAAIAGEKLANAQTATVPTGFSPQEFEALMAARLAPLEERISDMAEKRRYQDIIGAAGYIIGLFGLAFFVLGRKRR
ncbi:MAG: hypothetical protein ACPGOV_08710 [Magnetovibrionaceae bacterium]